MSIATVSSPIGRTWDEFFLKGPQASEDFMAERAAQQQSGEGLTLVTNNLGEFERVPGLLMENWASGSV